jgi:hypothetical protein
MFSRMELSDLLLLVHTIGCVACTPAAADAPSGVNWPPNQQWPMPAPTDSDSVLSRIQAAVRQLDDWPNALYEMLKSVNLRFRPKPGSTGRKSVLVSRMGRILQHPPYELSGRPLQPIAEEVRRFVEQSVGQNLRTTYFSSVDPEAARIRSLLNPSKIAKELGVTSSHVRLNRAYRRAIDQLTENEKSLCTLELSCRVRSRTLDLFAKYCDGMTSSEMARAVEGHVSPRTRLTAWEHPLLLPADPDLIWMSRGDKRAVRYSLSSVNGVLARVRDLAARPSRNESRLQTLKIVAWQGGINRNFRKRDLLLAIFERRLKVFARDAEPKLSDLLVDPFEYKKIIRITPARRPLQPLAP